MEQHDGIKKSAKRKKQKSVTTHAWLARTRTGLLLISPNQFTDFAGWWMAEDTKPFYPQNSFPQITYDLGPVKVKVKVIIEDNEKV